jgi:hypothetical protein
MGNKHTSHGLYWLAYDMLLTKWEIFFKSLWPFSECKLLFEMKMKKVYSKTLLMFSSGSNFIFLLVFYLIMWVMKAPKNFGKITILKIRELISLGGLKTHLGKLALK